MASDLNSLVFLLGTNIETVTLVLLVVFALLIGGVAGVFGYRFLARKHVGSVKQECEKLRQEAQAESKEFLREAKIEAKEETQRLRAEVDREIKEKRS